MLSNTMAEVMFVPPTDPGIALFKSDRLPDEIPFLFCGGFLPVKGLLIPRLLSKFLFDATNARISTNFSDGVFGN